MTLEELVDEFATNVAAQKDAIFADKPDAKKANKHAKRYMDAFDELRARGNAGRDALTVLLSHPRMDVKVAAAGCLLKHRTTEARAILERAAAGQGLTAMEAQMTLKHWDEGTWNRD